MQYKLAGRLQSNFVLLTSGTGFDGGQDLFSSLTCSFQLFLNVQRT